MSNQRFLYYQAWCVTDGSIIASGIGYDGLDKQFDKITSVRILEVELGLSP